MPGYGKINVGTKDNPIWVSEQASATDIANAKNQAREDEIRSLFDDLIGTYSPGGSYMQGMEAELTQQKQKDLASATSNLISSGLYGSTMTAALPSKWESEVGTTARAKLEDVRTNAYTNVMGQYTNFLNSITESSPSYETVANLTAQSASAPTSTGSWLSKYFTGGSNSLMSSGSGSSTSSSSNTTEDEWTRQHRIALENLRKQYGTVGVA